MKITEVEDRTAELIDNLLKVWEDSVRATHLFLSDEEMKKIKKYVPLALREISHLVIVEDEDNMPIAFMGVEEKKIEMLFIQNKDRGKGIGKKLLNYAIENFAVNEVSVNEQNPQALYFYYHMGFQTYKRTELDEQGNPYPILYLKLND